MFGWLKRMVTTRPLPLLVNWHGSNGRYVANKDIPLWKRDAVVFDAYVKELEKKHNCRYRFKV